MKKKYMDELVADTKKTVGSLCRRFRAAKDFRDKYVCFVLREVVSKEQINYLISELSAKVPMNIHDWEYDLDITRNRYNVRALFAVEE